MDKFFKAKSIAIIGASRNPNKVGHVILKNLLESHYHGKLYPVNPNTSQLINLKCYPSVLQIKNQVDLAVVSVPASLTLKAVEDCGKKGIKNIVIISAGFSEVGNHELDNKLLSLVKKYKINLIGPNVLGIYDAHSGVDTLFLPRLRLNRPQPGTISFICQSGAVGSASLDLISREGYGFAKFISYGNALSIDESDLLEYLGNDKETKVICMYIEGIKDGKKFIKVASNVTKKKPVIVIKGGTTEAGSKAALSHTSALAGSFEIYKGAFKQSGIILAESLEDLFNYAKVLEKCIKPKGNRVQVITNGGGYGILCADNIEQNNLIPARLSESTVNALKKIFPPLVLVSNPMDLIGDTDTKRYETAIEYCLQDANIDIILVVLLYQTPLITSDIVDMITEFNNRKEKPIVVISTGGEFTEIHKRDMELAGVPCFTFPHQAVKSIKTLCDYYLR
ncbi:MAG TPA: CoA-binding protein [Candidatus Nanoarchaeia archaeon]|nr:CoA-binding protein [Candidatus Nanoarchaeia archaeon]